MIAWLDFIRLGALKPLTTISILWCGIILSPAGAVHAAPVDFYHEIRPILVQQCSSCHGGVKRKGGLSLIARPDSHSMPKSGRPTLIPGNSAGSELYQRIIHSDPEERMPAGAEPLSARQTELIRRWIDEGAPWPVHWAFATRSEETPPPVQRADWARNPIDSFVLARLERDNFHPAPEAEPSTLIRRLYLDLIGLLPTRDEVESFLHDSSPLAWDALVERLLASPHFGERWGRHWLDLARYADTDGYEVDGDRPHAWYWRDWVIDAVNADMPFDQFTVEQLAGDLLPRAGFSQRLATAFHRQTLVNKEGGIDKEEYRTYAVMDRVNTTATVWLGLTMACAQCHDHPYDPLSQREYYQWFALFNNADETTLRLPNRGEAQFQSRKAAHLKALESLQATLSIAPENERAAVKREMEALEKKAPKDPAHFLDVLEERTEPRLTYLLRGGNFLHPVLEDVIAPGLLKKIHPVTPAKASRPMNRWGLAQWLVDPANPLTPRVTVNQVWMKLFGTGLVRTSDDYGASGESPSHPELLNWLSKQFVENGWSRKSLIKLIVTSATYRQSSRHRTEMAQIDPENRLLHRQNRFRVEGETVRDLHLDAAGLLSHRLKGPSVYPPFPPELARIDFRSDMKWVESRGEARYRRGLYTFYKRTLPDPNLTVFDCPDASATAVQRRQSNTPLQALAALNNEVFVEAAQAMATRVTQLCDDDAKRLQAAFEIALSRGPSGLEAAQLSRLLEDSRVMLGQDADNARRLLGAHAPEKKAATERAAWMVVLSVILNLDEFITRE